MMNSGIIRPGCFFLAVMLGVPAAFAQKPLPPPQSATLKSPNFELSIAVIEGDNALNSIPLLRSVTPVIEVRDANDFPVEGASVVFSMPAEGPGGRFLGDHVTLATRSDSHGQASAPFLMNVLPGKFQIKVDATAGSRKGQAFITQTNSTGSYSGASLPPRSWTKKWSTWAIIGGGAAAVITILLVKRGSNSNSSSQSTVTVTPGGPIFH